MKYFYIIGGLFILIFPCLIPMPRAWEQYVIARDGSLTRARIMNVGKPNKWAKSYNKKRPIHLDVNGKEIIKELPLPFSDTLKAGDSISVLWLPGRDQVMLPKNDPDDHEFFASLILGALGIYFIIRGLRVRKR